MGLCGLHEHHNCWNPQVLRVSGPSRHALVDGQVLTNEQNYGKSQQSDRPQPRRINVQKGNSKFPNLLLFGTMGAGHCAGCKHKECFCSWRSTRAHNLETKWPHQMVNLIFDLRQFGSTILARLGCPLPRRPEYSNPLPGGALLVIPWICWNYRMFPIYQV